MKKMLAILLVAMLSLCSCSEQEQEITKITVMTEGETLYWNEIKIDNVEIRVEIVPQGTIAEKVLNAEKKPDIVYLKSKEDMEKLSTVLKDISDLELDGYDRAKFACSDYDETERRHASSTGEHYVLPDYTANRNGVERAWLYRADIFQAAGITPPETMSELAAACTKLKGEYPESTPLVIRDGYYGLDLLAPAWKNNASLGAYYDFDEEKWCYGLNEPWAGNFVSYWSTMVQSGLVPQNYLTMTASEVDALIKSGSAFIVPDYVWRLEEYNKRGEIWRIMAAPRADIEGGQNKIAKREGAFAGVAICNEGEATLEVVNMFFLNSCLRDVPKADPVRLAQIYTENNINPARYIPTINTQEKKRINTHLEGMLPAFLTGEIPMTRWASFAAQLEDVGLKEFLSQYKRAYNSAKK